MTSIDVEPNTQSAGDAWSSRIAEHMNWLAGLSYATHTLRSRRANLFTFRQWCGARNVHRLEEVTLFVLEDYRAWLTKVRIVRASGPGRAGEHLGWGSQAQRLVAVRRFFAWAVRNGIVALNPAADLELPKQPQRIPRDILNVAEVERVLALPDVDDAMGLRDRAMLETLYSTGMRRQELINLTMSDVDPERGTVFIRDGKGKKDRLIPIGQRALMWVDRYSTLARPTLASLGDSGSLFLTRRGRCLRPNRLSELLHGYLIRAGLRDRGSCHVFRHTMATLMLEGGADVRYIQEMLGHAQLTTTQRYTRVAITQLKLVHARTHPARLPEEAGRIERPHTI